MSDMVSITAPIESWMLVRELLKARLPAFEARILYEEINDAALVWTREVLMSLEEGNGADE